LNSYHAFNLDLSPLPTANSSSVVASLLYYIGVDIAENMPSRFLSYTVGTRTLLGSTQADELTLEWSFNTILSGDGDDKLKGTDRTAVIEKLYGGSGDDTFIWSHGSHIYHGGQPELDYASDGSDTIDYTGVGFVRIEAGDTPVPHLRPDYIAFHSSGVDRLFSIEIMNWDSRSDTISLGEGVELTEVKPVLDFKGQKSDDRGDTTDLSNRTSSVMVAQSDEADVVLIGARAENGNFADGGIWARSLEWLIGTAGDDRIYAGSTMTGAEGGDGNDILSGRSSTPMAGLSPLGFDIELLGGNGSDTLISGTGRSLASGGVGADTFVLSSLSGPKGTTEFVIADADTSDRLFVPYNFITPVAGDYEGSLLFPILGAFTPIIGGATFADLPQNPGPLSNGHASEGYFYLATMVKTYEYSTGAWDGWVEISDQILFNRDGNDLLIHVYAGGDWSFSPSYIWLQEHTFQFEALELDRSSVAVIRVENFQEGMLGINFYELGEETPFPFPGGERETDPAKFWNRSQFAQNGQASLRDALEAEPATPIFDKPGDGEADQRQLVSGTSDNDVLTVAMATGEFSSGADMSGGAGDDQLNGGTGRDVLDGGSGTDTMSGGAGNDRYVVDTAADVVVEFADSGIDTVVASLSYALPGNVEHLTLTTPGTAGVGNALNNRLTGSSGADTLSGLQGNDTLAGGLGDDILDGGAGSDSYVYNAGDGNDIIRASSDHAGFDTLALIGMGTADVRIFKGTNESDVIFRLTDGSRIVLESFFGGGSIDAAGFEDGTVWNSAFVTAAANASGVLINDAPIARDDDGILAFRKDFVISEALLLANDRDVDGDTLTIVAARSRTAGATVALTQDGDVRLQAKPDQTGIVEFEYTVSDGRGGETTAAVSVEILPNNAPVFSGPALRPQTLLAGQAASFAVPAGRFSDPDGDTLVYSAELANGNPLPRWLRYDASKNVFSGAPPAGFNADLAVRLIASDGIAETSTIFNVSIVNRPPNAVLTGTNNADVLTAGDGNDTLIGGDGNDTLLGGRGNDVFLVIGFEGFDLYDGGEGLDTIRGTAGDDVIGLEGFGNKASGSRPADNLISIEVIDGGAGNDVLRMNGNGSSYDFSSIRLTGIELIEGSAGDDWIAGSAGNDVIDGREGADILFGGAGNDTFLIKAAEAMDSFHGGPGFDTIRGSAGRDVLQLRNGSRDLVSIELIDMGQDYDTVQLSNEDDEIDLSAIQVRGLERIEGLGGNDRIRGSSAGEMLAGGAGQDVFVFAGRFGADTIADFELGGGDRIDVSAFRFASFSQLLSYTKQIGDHSVITLASAASSITIQDVSKSLLTADDFVL